MKRLELKKITRDERCQPRVQTSIDVVDRYAAAMKDGAKFPSVVVFDDGENKWLADGWHRVAAWERNGEKAIPCEVKSGDLRKAILYAVGINAQHGFPRSNADKRRAVEILLRDPEWAKWNAVKIAKTCGVSDMFVGKLRNLSSNGLKIDATDEKRLVTRNGKTFSIQTKAIGATGAIAKSVRDQLRDQPVWDDPKERIKLAKVEGTAAQKKVAQQILSGKASSVTAALKSLQREDKQARKSFKVPKRFKGRFTLHCGDLAEAGAKVADNSVDWIITDPPYPKEYLPVYKDLGAFAARVLKPGGSLVAMNGQSYLPEIMGLLAGHGDLRYHWMLAYLTPGGQAVQIWDRKVNTFWKPLLWYMKGEQNKKADWIGDSTKSEVNDNDKRFHDWGQSESGMADIVERFTFPNQVICDPFVGGGTTAVVALQMNRKFIGIDNDAKQISATKNRIAELG